MCVCALCVCSCVALVTVDEDVVRFRLCACAVRAQCLWETKRAQNKIELNQATRTLEISHAQYAQATVCVKKRERPST